MEYTKTELLFERIWSIIRDLLIYSLTLGIIVGGYLLLTSTKVSAMSLKTTLTSNPQIEEILNKEKAMNALAYAVAMHETHGCKDETNFTKVNNCHGIREYNGVKLNPRKYSTKYQSYEDFKEIWARMYGTTYPTKDNAETWSGKDNSEAWLANVTYYIEQFNNNNII